MRTRKRSYLVALAVTAAVAATPGGAAAQGLQQTITSLDAAAPVAAWNHVVAWSQRDPQTGAFKLIVAHGRTYHEVTVPTRSVPFDVDVGPGPNGGAIVVYSRCTTEPPDPSVLGLSTLPDYTLGQGCRLYAWDVAAERQSALKRSGVLPSIWYERLAYARGSRLIGSVGRHAGRTLIKGLHGFRP